MRSSSASPSGSTSNHTPRANSRRSWNALLTGEICFSARRRRDGWPASATASRSEEHTSELQSRQYLHSFPTRRSSDLLAAVTLIFATDRPGKLLNALVKRISIRVHFQPYPEGELKEIVERVADRRDLLFSPQAARRLARVCNGLQIGRAHV